MFFYKRETFSGTRNKPNQTKKKKEKLWGEERLNFNETLKNPKISG